MEQQIALRNPRAQIAGRMFPRGQGGGDGINRTASGEKSASAVATDLLVKIVVSVIQRASRQ